MGAHLNSPTKSVPTAYVLLKTKTILPSNTEASLESWQITLLVKPLDMLSSQNKSQLGPGKNSEVFISNN